MSGGDDEVDGTGGEGRITGAQQLFGTLALALAVDYLLAAIREAGVRATWAWFSEIGHSTHQLSNKLTYRPTDYHLEVLTRHFPYIIFHWKNFKHRDAKARRRKETTHRVS